MRGECREKKNRECSARRVIMEGKEGGDCEENVEGRKKGSVMRG
jgi:hypothetical protein